MALLVRLSLVAFLLSFPAVPGKAATIYQMNLYNASGRPVDLMYKKSGNKWAS
jgi:hypothetical protein